ncbi:MAG: SRPBCC family protein [Caulobacteraceae bacterium]
MRIAWIAGLAALAFGAAARAEVVDVQPQGFQIKETVEIAAPPARVWAALVEPGRWWSPKHSWSGDPVKNMTLEARPGGCFCEQTPGGGAKHLEVVFVDRDKQLDLWGALGPLHWEGAAGGMSIRLKAKDANDTTLTLTYTVGGYLTGGSQKWAPLVDGVLGEQTARLKRYVETGVADSAAPNKP